MKNGIEIRPNGIKIVKRVTISHYPSNNINQYHVEGSKNGPWDYLLNARKDADSMKEVK